MTEAVSFEVEEVRLNITIAEPEPLRFAIEEETLATSVVEEVIQLRHEEQTFNFPQVVEELHFELVEAEGPTGPAPPPIALEEVVLSVPPLVERTIDSFSKDDYRSALWVISVEDPMGGQYGSSEVLASHNEGDINFTEYGMVGDQGIYEVSVEMNVSTVELRVRNLDTTNSYRVAVQRLRLTT
jgi:hypothetical protein